MIFNQYPYINVNDLNLDYILSQIKTMMNEVTNFVSINAIKYADPIQWDITRQYEKNTVVIDPVTGTAYISVAPVPAGVALTRPEYWTVVFDLGSFVTRAAQNFTSRYESETTLTATFPTSAGDWLVWGDVLYKALVNITAGDTYVVGSNIEHFTMEMLVGHLDSLNTETKTSIVAAINELVLSILRVRNSFTYTNFNWSDTYPVYLPAGKYFWWKEDSYRTTVNVNAGDTIVNGTNCEAIQISTIVSEIYTAINGVIGTIGNLLNLNTSDKSSVVNAINELFGDITTLASNVATISNNIGNLTNLLTTDKTSIVNAINELYVRGASKAWIIVGDSYGETPSLGQDWCTLVRDGLLAHNIPAYRCHISGGSFGNSVKYLTALQNLTVSDPYQITDILVCGGYNDITVQSAMPAGITDFINYVHTNYPNARVHIGICCLTDQQNMLTVMFNMVQNLTKWSKLYDFSVVENSWYMHRRYDLMASDGIHTTLGASERIAFGILGYCLNNNVAIYNEYASGTFAIDPANVTTGSITDLEMRSLDDVKVDLNLGYMSFATTSALNKQIGTITTPAFMRGAYSILVPISGWAVDGNGNDRNWVGSLSISTGNLIVATSDPEDVSAIVFNRTSFTLPFTIA